MDKWIKIIACKWPYHYPKIFDRFPYIKSLYREPHIKSLHYRKYYQKNLENLNLLIRLFVTSQHIQPFLKKWATIKITLFKINPIFFN